EYSASVVLSTEFHKRYHALLINPPQNASRDPFFWVPVQGGSAAFVVSTLPTGEVNARVIQFRKEAIYFVLFETQLFSFLNLIAKCIAPFFRERDEAV